MEHFSPTTNNRQPNKTTRAIVKLAPPHPYAITHTLSTTCTLCKQTTYIGQTTNIGQTTRRFHDRAWGHFTAVKRKNRTSAKGEHYIAPRQQSRHQFGHPKTLQGRFTPAYQRGPKNSGTSTRNEQKKQYLITGFLPYTTHPTHELNA